MRTVFIRHDAGRFTFLPLPSGVRRRYSRLRYSHLLFRNGPPSKRHA